MSRTRSEMDAGLAALYARIPAIPDCDGRCWTSCGPVDMSWRERSRIRAAGVRITPWEDAKAWSETFWCEALTEGKRCAVYEMRPLVCFLPETWIYTAEGPKRIGDVLAGERVYGADGQLHLVTGTASRIHRGGIVDVRHTGTHLAAWCTLDHQWLTAFQRDKRKRPAPGWARADSLTPKRHHQDGNYLCYPRRFAERAPLDTLNVAEFVSGRPQGDYLVPFTSGSNIRGHVQAIPRYLDASDELLFMIGIYLAEGSASSQGASFTMSPHEKPVLERIAKHLSALGIPVTLRVGRAAVLSVHTALFGRLLRELCGTSGYGRMDGAGKRLHPVLFSRLSNAQLWAVYEGWDVGDGRKCLREQEMSTTTTSEWLAVQMSFVALLNGMFPRIYESHRSSRSTISYDVHLFPSNWRDCKPGYGTKNMFDDDYVYSPVGGDGQYRSASRTKHYEGPVIDLQVQGAESFVTSSGIAHNCRLWGAAEGLECPFGCAPEGGYIPRAEAYRMIAESMRIGGHQNAASAREVEEALRRSEVAEELSRLRDRGQRGDALRADEVIPAAFRRNRTRDSGDIR